MNKLPICVLLALALSACATVKGPSDKGITASFKNEPSTSFVAGYQPVNVRVSQEGKGLEATCTIDSAKYSTEPFKTPATVNLPAYSQGAANVTLSCTYDGETMAKAFAPENLSKKARAGSAIGVAILCPICGVGVAAANSGRNKENDIYGFTKLEIEL
ncbi:hypothetical protein [Shimia sp.]|uniref:hypothetical protein n=1 Tax=Shimia sp. TaxID=1954381 RepID=UPI003B8BBE4F